MQISLTEYLNTRVSIKRDRLKSDKSVDKSTEL